MKAIKQFLIKFAKTVHYGMMCNVIGILYITYMLGHITKETYINVVAQIVEFKEQTLIANTGAFTELLIQIAVNLTIVILIIGVN